MIRASREMAALAVLIPLVALGCSSVLPASSSARARSDEVEELRNRVRELEQEARMSEVEIRRLRRQVAELVAELESARGAGAEPAVPEAAPAPEGDSEPLVEPTDLAAEDVEFEEPEAEETVAEGETVQPPALPAEAQALYDRGYTFYHQERYVDAEAAFRGYLQSYPQSDLADNAQFWIGQARYQRGDLNGALAAFREAEERYPEGNKVPDVIFKAGDCLEQLGDLEGALSAFTEVIERFPSSAAAALAEERLAELR